MEIDATKTKELISKYIYGQFIEHLGRCIYGSIGAEMLQDRKFCYTVNEKDSLWKAIGDKAAVRTCKNKKCYRIAFWLI